MEELRFPITGGDYETGGRATAQIKTILKRLGVEPEAVRRAVIALYEAEMNVVIHAHGGHVALQLAPGRIDAVVQDSGPGIADLALALTEGYSTAPQNARELGFGAGMGLPNIKRNCDVFELTSAVGQGTRLAFTVNYQSPPRFVLGHYAVTICAERCNGCLRCLSACPTQALRVRGNRPQILPHLCVDCASCVGVCKPGALTLLTNAPAAAPARQPLLVVPRHFPWQFGTQHNAAQVESALVKAGFSNVRSIAAWEDALRVAVADFARDEAPALPVISPVCPAVINLIAVRFPALLSAVAPFASPVEAARWEAGDRPAALAIDCPCHFTAWMDDPSRPLEAVDFHALRERLWPLLPADLPPPPPAPAASSEDTLFAGGWVMVTALLEQLENGRLTGWRVLELYACAGGCAGSPFAKEVPAVAEARDRRERPAEKACAVAHRLAEPRRPRAGLRLDENMFRAMEKLARIDQLTRSLPGKNCGHCGAPTCQALAEDLVLGRVETNLCPYVTPEGGKS